MKTDPKLFAFYCEVCREVCLAASFCHTEPQDRRQAGASEESLSPIHQSTPLAAAPESGAEASAALSPLTFFGNPRAML